MTCSKLAKWLIIMTCSKLAVLNKAIQGTFFKSQKSKNRLKSYLLWKAVASRIIHGNFLSLKKVKKRIYGNYGSIFACDLERCPWSLYLPLLRALSTTLLFLKSSCFFLNQSMRHKYKQSTREVLETQNFNLNVAKLLLYKKPSFPPLIDKCLKKGSFSVSWPQTTKDVNGFIKIES